LENKELIRSQLIFKILARIEGIDTELQAGDFRLSQAMTPKEILLQLSHGSLDIWITIPEGKRREQIAGIIDEAFENAERDFAEQEFLDKTATREGFLFPDTYLVPKDARIDTIIAIMEQNFNEKFKDLKLQTYLTKEQSVVLASLIEREAKFEKDRYKIAGVLIKRLKNGWPLQVDDMIQNAKASRNCGNNLDCNWWPAILANADLKMDSPYNTYKQKGLPPAAICNPGLSSIKAAINPEDNDYWYYLSEPSGVTHYSKTLEEHNQNINKYLSN
jgi:UPF0755 protein